MANGTAVSQQPAVIQGQAQPLSPLVAMFLIWMGITAATPLFNRVVDLRHINEWIWPAVRMALMLLATALYTRFGERRSFTSAFNLSFRKLGRSAVWAVVFFVVALVLVGGYERFILTPLTASKTASSLVIETEPVRPLAERVIEYSYVLFEGIVEVLIFIGFLLDRLARRIGWFWALFLSNIAFALWHYNYLAAGWRTGSLMMLLTFIAGVIVSLSYLKARNALSPAICHTLVDLSSEISPLLGLG